MSTSLEQLAGLHFRYSYVLIAFILSLTKVVFDDAAICCLAGAFSLMPTVHQHKIHQSRSHHNVIYLQTDEDDTVFTDDIHNTIDAPTAFYNHESYNILTSAVLKIAYDGTHFSGWTGSGHQAQVSCKNCTNYMV